MGAMPLKQLTGKICELWKGTLANESLPKLSGVSMDCRVMWSDQAPRDALWPGIALFASHTLLAISLRPEIHEKLVSIGDLELTLNKARQRERKLERFKKGLSKSDSILEQITRDQTIDRANLRKRDSRVEELGRQTATDLEQFNDPRLDPLHELLIEHLAGRRTFQTREDGEPTKLLQLLPIFHGENVAALTACPALYDALESLAKEERAVKRENDRICGQDLVVLGHLKNGYGLSRREQLREVSLEQQRLAERYSKLESLTLPIHKITAGTGEIMQPLTMFLAMLSDYHTESIEHFRGVSKHRARLAEYW